MFILTQRKLWIVRAGLFPWPLHSDDAVTCVPFRSSRLPDLLSIVCLRQGFSMVSRIPALT